MEVEPEINHLNRDNDADDPIVLAYRIGKKSLRAILRVRRSELERDPTLFEIKSSAQSIGFDAEETARTPTKEKRSPDLYVQRKIQYKLMLHDIQRRVDEEELTFESLPKDLKIESINDPGAQQILALVTKQLKKEGLWRDEDKDLTMSEAFPLSQMSNDSRIRSANHIEAEFLTESDLTFEDRSASEHEFQLRMSGSLFKYPKLSEPMLHNLMRASPRDLYHQLARRMIDAHFFEDHPEHQNLFPACYLISKGVRDERHFATLMRAGLKNNFPHYTFEEFRIERVLLRKIIRQLIDGFFVSNPAVKRRLKFQTDPVKRDPKNIWSRFYSVWNSLTEKQQEALEAVYMDQNPLTKKEAARKFGIDFESLKSRLKAAIQRFKNEFPEFEGMSPKRLPRSMLTGQVTHNGLWRYQSALWKAPLFKIDLKTNLKVEIEWHKLPKAKNLDWKTIARIKAEIIENCPVPHFHETEYFDGTKPTIFSFGRSPGNLKESDRDFDEGFREF